MYFVGQEVGTSQAILVASKNNIFILRWGYFQTFLRWQKFDISDWKSGHLQLFLWKQKLEIFDGKFEHLQPFWGNRSTSFYQDLGTISRQFSRGILWQQKMEIFNGKSGHLGPFWRNRSECFYQELGTISRHVCSNEKQILWWEVRTFLEVFWCDKCWIFWTGSPDISSQSCGIKKNDIFILRSGYFSLFLWTQKLEILMGSLDISGRFGETKACVFIKTLG